MSESLIAATSGGPRRPQDFYPTPWDVTEAILPRIADFPQEIWEPACGDGAMSKVLEKAGHAVISTDLIDRGYGTGGEDFLTRVAARGESLVTNPPFDKAREFIEQAFDLGVSHCAMLLKTSFWHAKRRASLFHKWQPAEIWALTWRPDFTGAGRPHRDAIWVVWRPTAQPTTYGLLHRPAWKPKGFEELTPGPVA